MAQIEDCTVGTVVGHPSYPGSPGRIIGRRVGNRLEGYTVTLDGTAGPPGEVGPDRILVELTPTVPVDRGNAPLRVACFPEDVTLAG